MIIVVDTKKTYNTYVPLKTATIPLLDLGSRRIAMDTVQWYLNNLRASVLEPVCRPQAERTYCFRFVLI